MLDCGSFPSPSLLHLLHFLLFFSSLPHNYQYLYQNRSRKTEYSSAHPPSLSFCWHLATSAYRYLGALYWFHPECLFLFMNILTLSCEKYELQALFLRLFHSVMKSLGSGLNCYFCSSWMISCNDTVAADSTPPWRPSHSSIRSH